jgi:hypothetical protein
MHIPINIFKRNQRSTAFRKRINGIMDIIFQFCDTFEYLQKIQAEDVTDDTGLNIKLT